MHEPLHEPVDDPLRFALLGVDHMHAFSMVGLLAGASAEFAGYWTEDGPLVDGFSKVFAQATRSADAAELLEDASIDLIACAAVPDKRAGLAEAAMRHGKHCFLDKPGVISLGELERLQRVQNETGKRWVVFFSERLASAATARASELVEEGAIGRVVHVMGTGPHRIGSGPRPDWFYDRARYGGILADIGAHQADQFLHFTGATEVAVTAAHVGNLAHPDHPAFEDFGEMLLRSAQATGYARVDWFTPDGLASWGDVRLTLVGTEGTLEVRKNLDVAGREGAEHLFLTDATGSRHEDCANFPLSFPAAFLADLRDGTELAITQDHVFRASELALRAQSLALDLGHLA
jgi:predicted dehydrogenase